MNKQKILRTTGNIFILCSLVGFILTYFPLWPYLFAKNVRTEHSEFLNKSELQGIFIPKIGAQANIIYSVDPWNQKEYSHALEKGIAQAKGTSLPGRSGTTYLFAHSSLPPWLMTRTNTPFLFLDELSNNDPIYIRKDQDLYTYTVIGKREVWPSDTQYLTKSQDGIDLILQTCAPIGTSIKRLLIFAKMSPGV